MQRQKTIAKWLAVVLLLTVALACYIAFGTDVLKKNADNIAGAGDKTNGDTSNGSQTEPIKPEPVYSTFPRPAELVDGAAVQHVGGEGNENYLESFYISDKLLVLFSTASEQYDVKEQGIHVARFDNDNLVSVHKICGNDEEYVCATLGATGIIVITKSNTATVLRVINSSCLVTAKNTAPLYASYKLYTSGRELYMFACDNEFVYAHTISSNLDVSASNFVFPIIAAELKHVMQYGSDIMVCAQSAKDLTLLSYNKTKGFTYKNNYINCEFVQLMPTVADSKQAAVLLLKTQKGLTLRGIDINYVTKYEYEADGEETGVIYKEQSTFKLVTPKKAVALCSHLELINETQLTGFVSKDSPVDGENYALTNAKIHEELNLGNTLRFEYINGAKDLFIAYAPSGFALCRMSNDKINVLLSARSDSKKIGHLAFADKRTALEGKVTYDTVLLFNATVQNDFAYMSFGKNDLYAISLLT